MQFQNEATVVYVLQLLQHVLEGKPQLVDDALELQPRPVTDRFTWWQSSLTLAIHFQLLFFSADYFLVRRKLKKKGERNKCIQMECWKGWTNGPAGCFLDQDQANLRRQSREDEQLEPFRRQAAQQNAHQGAEQWTAVSDSNCGVMERQASVLSRAKRL